MDRAAGQHRLERKRARRRTRIANGKRRHSPHRGIQAAERAVIAPHNLDNLIRMASSKGSKLRIFAKVKPRLIHVPETAKLGQGFGIKKVMP